MRAKAIVAAMVMLAVTLGLTFAYNSTYAGAKRMATLTHIKGEVKVKAPDSAEWAAATDRMVVNEGDEVKTAAGSSAIIKMDDGSMVKIGPLAKMKMESMGKDGRHNKTDIGVSIGKSWQRVNKLSADSSFKVKTPTAVAGVRGTFFSSEVEQSTDSTFDCFDGAIDVASADDPNNTVPVTAGYRTQVTQDGNLNQPSQIPQDQMQAGQQGFSSSEAAMATYDLQISVSPQVVKPGENATVSLQVFKNGQPLRQEVTVNLTLSGGATFTDNGENTKEVTTSDQGSATLEVTSSSNETVTVSAELKIKVQQ